MTKFIFVHGTFTRSADWPSLKIALSSAEICADGASFEEVRWSGRNRADARQAASFEIRKHASNALAVSDVEPVFLIGHSHGGSAIAYFLKKNPDLASKIRGVAFLSTPFVAMRARKNAMVLIGAIGFFFMIVLFYAVVSSFPQLSKNTSLLYYVTHWSQVTAIMIIISIGTFVGVTVDKAHKHAERILGEQTADIPQGNYLIMRASGDEASALLAAGQFSLWLSLRVADLIAWLTPWTHNNFLRRWIHNIFCIGLSMIVVLGFWGDTSNRNIPFQIEQIFDRIVEGDPSTIAWIVAFFVLSSIIAFAVAAIFLQALTSWLFGWTSFLAGLFIELSVEPVPFGPHLLQHINWNAASGEGMLLHSWTHSHPDAIEKISSWVRANLRGALDGSN